MEITSTIMVGRTHPVKTFAGSVGDKLRFRRRECLDIRFQDPAKMRNHDLAFGGDRLALKLWAGMKDRHNELGEQPLPARCQRCGSPSVATVFRPSGGR